MMQGWNLACEATLLKGENICHHLPEISVFHQWGIKELSKSCCFWVALLCIDNFINVSTISAKLSIKNGQSNLETMWLVVRFCQINDGKYCMTSHTQYVKLNWCEKMALLFKPFKGTCQRERKSALRRLLLSEDYDLQGLQMEI